jgi:hypothetical protein
LPLVHTTSSPAFEYDIAPFSKLISPKKCTVYGDQLIYFFYGKPSYRPQNAKDSYHADMMQFAPVCIVLDTPAAYVPRRVMPFDSGAYNDGMMAREGHAHPALRKELFEVNGQDAAGAIVGVFFGSNLSYYDERPICPPLVNTRTNTCVETYVSLISRTGTNQGDSRLNTIEIQFDRDIDLNGNVLAVAIAEPFYASRTEIQDTLKNWGAEPLIYPLDGRFTPGECCSLIDRLVRKFLSDRGIL